MLRITSREYKLMLRHHRFSKIEPALDEFCASLSDIADKTGSRLIGSFDGLSERGIDFRDTPDRRLAKNGLVLRFRQRKKRDEITLKCRTPDRYIAADVPLSASRNFDSEQKFEEDISRPFVSRFSHSTTVQLPLGASTKYSTGLKALCRLFPGLRKIKSSAGDLSSGKLESVSKIRPVERVHTGPLFRIGSEEMEIALILWHDFKSDAVLLAEFSYRYSAAREQFTGQVAQLAQDLFTMLQSSKWVAPNSKTKTQFMFEGS